MDEEFVAEDRSERTVQPAQGRMVPRKGGQHRGGWIPQKCPDDPSAPQGKAGRGSTPPLRLNHAVKRDVPLRRSRQISGACDLGGSYFYQCDRSGVVRRMKRRIEALGEKVVLQSAV